MLAAVCDQAIASDDFGLVARRTFAVHNDDVVRNTCSLDSLRSFMRAAALSAPPESIGNVAMAARVCP